MGKTNIGYIGEVTISYEKNGRSCKEILHNEGKPALFETLATLLSGGGFPYGSPSYISLYDANGENILNQDTLPITTRPFPKKDSVGKWACAIMARIRYSDMRESPSGEKATLSLRTNSYGKTELATVQLEVNKLPASEGTSLLIEWDLFFENAPTPTTPT